MKSDMAEWIDRRYDILWEAFGDKTFRFEDAAKVLKEKNKDTEEQVPVFLSQLRKAGFLTAESDARDARQNFTVYIAVKQKSLKNLDAVTLTPCSNELRI